MRWKVCGGMRTRSPTLTRNRWGVPAPMYSVPGPLSLAAAAVRHVAEFPGIRPEGPEVRVLTGEAILHFRPTGAVPSLFCCACAIRESQFLKWVSEGGF